MRVLVGCETSGAVREAFRACGFDAWSCDVLESEDSSPHHLQCDLFFAIEQCGPWDVLIAHPPCTFLCSSGLHWNKRTPGRAEKTEEALDFVRRVMSADIRYKAIENPVGCISTRIKKATQYIQPYQFGHSASKKTGLWLQGLPPLYGTKRVAGRWVQYRGKWVERWQNQTDSGQNAVPPSADRWKERSKTYPGIAGAMAAQWGAFLLWGESVAA
ncbi:hypothetical protein D8911_14660 (plasmid) [Levilactobacillus brevis]|nr:hypothetical protein D8911_14660 [Levilactobacillus brevis]